MGRCIRVEEEGGGGGKCGEVGGRIDLVRALPPPFESGKRRLTCGTPLCRPERPSFPTTLLRTALQWPTTRLALPLTLGAAPRRPTTLLLPGSEQGQARLVRLL